MVIVHQQQSKKRRPNYTPRRPEMAASNFPTRGRSTNFPTRGRSTNFPTRGRSSNFPTRARSAIFTMRGRSANFPTRGRSANFPTRAHSAIFPTRARSAIFPTRARSTIVMTDTVRNKRQKTETEELVLPSAPATFTPITNRIINLPKSTHQTNSNWFLNTTRQTQILPSEQEVEVVRPSLENHGMEMPSEQEVEVVRPSLENHGMEVNLIFLSVLDSCVLILIYLLQMPSDQEVEVVRPPLENHGMEMPNEQDDEIDMPLLEYYGTEQSQDDIAVNEEVEMASGRSSFVLKCLCGRKIKFEMTEL
ncbi:uncharacterized protein [Solanum lycopersicum]|uniref:uncharacterized protein isoform X20 n=1 Tax=Solanum lycopersicum TaxID=4081 RepID=UPI0037495A81